MPQGREVIDLQTLSPATVATGGVATDMTLGADGSPYSGFSGGNTTSADTREFRVYVTTQSSLIRVFGISANGTLSLKNDVHLQSSPLVVNVSGPDYPVFTANQRFAPHDLDKSVVVLNLASTTGLQYAPIPLAQGGVKPASTLTLSGEITPSAAAGTDSALAVGEGLKHQVSFYSQTLSQNVLAQGAASSAFDTQAKPSSIAPAAVYQTDAFQRTITKEYLYVATIAGLIYQFKGDGTPLSDDLLNPSNALPPIQTHTPQKLFVKGYRGRLYVVRPVDHEVTSYAIKNEGNDSDTIPVMDNGRLLESTAQSTQTGHDPAAITFLNTSTNAGAVQTTIR